MKAIIKSMDENKVILGGYAVIWGSWEDRDLENEFFTKETDFWLDRMPGPKPVLYHHGQHEAVKHSVLGRTIKLEKDNVGLTIEAELERHNEYIEQIIALVEEGVLGWSSGAVHHLVKRDSGYIKSWPIAEMTLTPTRAEPRLLGTEILNKVFTDAGLEIPEAFQRSEETENAVEDDSVDYKTLNTLVGVIATVFKRRSRNGD